VQIPPPSFQTVNHIACVLLSLTLGSIGCAPRASSVPLGQGPLALAEQAAEQSANARAASQTRADVARRRPTKSAPKPAKVSPEAKAEAELSEEGDAEKKDAAGTSDEKSASSSELDGLYSGEDVAISRLPGLPDWEQKDDKAQIRVQTDAPNVLSLTLINSDDGSDLCELSARLEGKTAVLDADQPCFTSNEEGGVQGELDSGRAVFDGNRLSMDAEGTLRQELADQVLEGELSYTFKGERQ
jgi:hypothetical protein